MKTEYRIIYPDGRDEIHSVDWPVEPGYERLSGLLTPIFKGDLEHVSVLHDGQYLDMFVDEKSALKGLPRNETATAIYRHFKLSTDPSVKPESLHAIYGTAVLFLRKVWV